MQIPDILKNKTVQLASTAVTALVVGGIGGYLYGKKQGTVTVVQPASQQMTFDFDKSEVAEVLAQDPQLEALLDEEERIQEQAQAAMRNDEVLHIPMEGDPQKVLDPRAAPEPKHDYTKPLRDEAARRELEHQAEVEEKPVLNFVNVFTVDDGQWVMEEELSQRSREAPYVIHVDEFSNDEMDFRQETLTYYAGDDIMADSADTPIYDYQGLMGTLKFGHGSGDKNVVYIRNEAIRMEWEILRESGSFEQEVLGFAIEQAAAEQDLKHSSTLKFRRGD